MVYDTIEKKRMYLQGLHPMWKNIWKWPEFKLNAIFYKEHSKEMTKYARELDEKYSHKKESL